MKTHIAICGASGRTGKRIIALAAADSTIHLAAAISSAAHVGTDAGELAGVGPLGLPLMTEIPITARVDAVIDFSWRAGSLSMLRTCVDRQIPILTATTGFPQDQGAKIAAAAHMPAVLVAANTSLVVNVLFNLVRQAGITLRDKGFD